MGLVRACIELDGTSEGLDGAGWDYDGLDGVGWD